MSSSILEQNQKLKSLYPTLWLAINHHKTHKGQRITFNNRSYLKDIYTDHSQYKVVMKSTQCGISEYLVAYSLARTIANRSLFYVLPTYQLMTRFVMNRFDKAVLQVPFYKEAMSNALGDSDSTHMKHIGLGTIVFAGSNTPNAFVEYPADELIIDELDRCDQDNLEMAHERLSASLEKRTIKVSNPTFNEYGIDWEFQKSDRKYWHIPCSSCGEWITPDFHKHVVRQDDNGDYDVIDQDYDEMAGIDPRPICHMCHKPYDRFAIGEWVAETKSNVSGYHISKMFSSTNTIGELLTRFEKGLVNDTSMQRFYNGDLGLPYIAVGTKITTDTLNDCTDDYNMPYHSGVNVSSVMGVDVGKVFHIRVNNILPDGRLKAVFIGSVPNQEQVVEIAERYRVRVAVIDALPETRISKWIAARIPSMFLCYFQDVKRMGIDLNTRQISIDRTELLDTVKEAIGDRKILLPKNAASINEYYDQMTASNRVLLDDRYQKLTDRDKPRYAWIHGSKADHYFLAEGYAILAYNIRNMIYSRK